MSDRVTIAIARALLSAVDLLLVQGCLELITDEQQATIVTLLHDVCACARLYICICTHVSARACTSTHMQFVEHRCCRLLATESSAIPEYLRKRKTVMLASRTDNIDKLCDMVIHLGTEGDAHRVEVVGNAMHAKNFAPANSQDFAVGTKVQVKPSPLWVLLHFFALQHLCARGSIRGEIDLMENWLLTQ